MTIQSQQPPDTRQTSTKAILALVFGVLAYLLLPLLAAIAAVVLGSQARREIRSSPESLKGDGLALAGFWLGLVQLIVLGFAIILALIITIIAVS